MDDNVQAHTSRVAEISTNFNLERATDPKIVLAAAARRRSGVAPGLSAKRAPSAWAVSRSAGVSTVPRPTTASGTSAMIAFAASRATGVRRVISRVVMPPATRARASGTAWASSGTVMTGITGEAASSASRR